MSRNLFILFFFLLKYVTNFGNNYENNYDTGNNFHYNYKEPKDSKEYLNNLKLNTYKCLNIPYNKTSTKVLSMSAYDKLEAFKSSDCAPIIVLPGFMGSKLEFKMTNCNLFEKYHPNIMKSCGWKTCNDPKLKRFNI